MSRGRRLPWLDVTRLVAMASVAAHHALTSVGLKSPDLLFGLDLGQIGVAVFFGLSGYLSVQGRSEPATVWLGKRLTRIFIPYWLAVAAVFLANAATAYKPVTIGLIVSEFAGVAGLFYGDKLIGVHFWFVSLLLLCYLAASLIRMFPSSAALFICFSVAIIPWHREYAGHALAFLICAGFGVTSADSPVSSTLIIAASGLGLLATLCGQHPFGSPLVAVASLLVLNIKAGLGPATPVIERCSLLSYHFYLVHGPIYLLMSRISNHSLWVVIIGGSVTSVAAAWCLRKAELHIRRLIGLDVPSQA